MKQKNFIPAFLSLLLVAVAGLVSAAGQERTYDSYKTDTIQLQGVLFAKTVAYKLNTVTFYVNYEDYKNTLYVLWKRYRDGMKTVKKEKRKGEHINPDYEPRWRTLDSVYTLLKTKVKTQDTLFLSQNIFDKVGLAPLSNFFPDLIEKKQCAIVDDKGQRHFLIIRQTGWKKTGEMTSYGGSSYFLPGQKKAFIGRMNWVT